MPSVQPTPAPSTPQPSSQPTVGPTTALFVPALRALPATTKTRSALRTPTWWIQEPGAAVPPGDVTIDALPSTTVRVPRRFRWTRGVLRRTDESYEGAVSPPRRLFVGAAEKRPQTSSAHLMLPGGPCTQSDEDLNHLMTNGSDRRCRRPKRSTSPRDEARSPHLDARKKIKQKHRTKFRVQFLSPGWRRPNRTISGHPELL